MRGARGRLRVRGMTISGSEDGRKMRDDMAGLQVILIVRGVLVAVVCAVWLVGPWLVGAAKCVAATINVPADFATIQGAIDAAVDGDVILVQKGNYSGPVDFSGKAITVRSASLDRSDVSIGGIGTLVIFEHGEGADSVLEGITLRQGVGSDYHGFNVAGGIRIVDSSPTILRCFFFNCSAGDMGGGLYASGSHARIISTSFFNCFSTFGLGGGIFADAASALSIENCVILNCNAEFGGGAYADLGSGIHFINSTISVNFARTRGAGMAVGADSIAVVENSIVWENADSFGSDEESQVFVHMPTGSAVVNYSDIQGGWTGIGFGNIDADPKFGAFDLTAGSPCIDAGDNSVVPTDLIFDYQGDLRLVDDPGMKDTGNGTSPIVDMGAYEFQGVSPCLSLGVVDLVSGGTATFTVERGIPGLGVVIAYGFGGGPSVFVDVNGYCATFGFDVPRGSKALKRVIATGVFDANGLFIAGKRVPKGLSGTAIRMQAAERGTCPDECMSEVVDGVIG